MQIIEPMFVLFIYLFLEEEHAACGVLFPEFELEIEDEDYSPEQTVKDKEEALQEFQQYVHDIETKQSGAAVGTQYSEEDLPDLEGLAAQETEDHRQFKKFQKRVAHKKDQVCMPHNGWSIVHALVEVQTAQRIQT